MEQRLQARSVHGPSLKITQGVGLSRDALRSGCNALLAASAALSCQAMVACLTSVPASAYESGVVGCWDRELSAPTDNKLNICFQPDGQLNGIYLEATGEAGDISGVWRLHRSKLTIAGEGCAIKFESSGGRFTLSHCTYEGMWDRCGDHDNVPGCAKK